MLGPNKQKEATTNHISKMYKKRQGTSGIQGQLYETKLISLIYFRMTYDDNVQQFSLATNRDDVGDFDDICLRAIVKGFDKPLAVFIQAKHKENNKLFTFTSETDLAKYFKSYLKIRHAFEPSSEDMIFKGQFDETQCFFIMYTTAKDDRNNQIYKGSFADFLNKLIGTGDCCTQPSYRDKDLDLLCKIVMKGQVRTVAELLVKFIFNEIDSKTWMSSDIMLRYHLILAQKVLDVSEIKPERHRIANFRQDFFTTNEEFVLLIKNILCLEVLKKRKSRQNDEVNLLLKFLSDPSDITTLSKLIGSVLTYKNNKLEFVSKSITGDLKGQLDKANVPQSTVYEAAELAAKEYLLSLKLKVPASFGNKDLTIRGDDKKIEKRLNHLTTKLLEILKQSKPNHTVTIDESLDEGFLQLNGGIASAVGNILVFDETSKLLKFTDSCQSLGNLAKRWYKTLKSKITNLHEYKLDVKVKKFPKLFFERGEYDVSLVRDFYSKLLFYTNQADQNGVEEILKEEIEYHPSNDVNKFRVRSELIFLKYHDEIQRLWLMPIEGSYLTENSKVFENAVTSAMKEPLIGVIKNMHNIKNKVFTFNENVIQEFAMQNQIIGSIITSESCVLTAAKIEQFLGNKDHVVLDLEYILKFSLKSHNSLCKELTNTTKEKILIVVCKAYQDSRHSGKRLEDIAKAVDGKQIIVTTNKISVDIMTEYFSQASNVWNDERSALTDLSVESQKNFLATYEIKFQGKYVSLDMIIDDESVGLIDKHVFYKIINNETIKIGNTIINTNYKKQFYIDRRVSRTKKQEHDKFDDVKDMDLKTLYDLEDDVVLITAKEGMGKSTLLSHLTLKTKEFDPKVWIVRINLTRIFETRRRLNRVVPIHPGELTTEHVVEFMCQAALDDESIQFEWDMGLTYPVYEKTYPFQNYPVKSPYHYFISKNRNVHPTEFYFSNANRCSWHLKMFQVKFFLHYYNRGKLIFLVDDFNRNQIKLHKDNDIVTKFLKLVASRKHKIWLISSQPSPNLEHRLGSSYKLENFSPLEKEIYLNTLWKFKIGFKNLYTNDIQDIEDFVDSVQERELYLKAYVIFLDFLKMESMAAGFDFPYDEFYDHFKTRFGLCENTIPCFPNDTTPVQLNVIAQSFINTNDRMDRILNCLLFSNDDELNTMNDL